MPKRRSRTIVCCFLANRGLGPRPVGPAVNVDEEGSTSVALFTMFVNSCSSSNSSCSAYSLCSFILITFVILLLFLLFFWFFTFLAFFNSHHICNFLWYPFTHLTIFLQTYLRIYLPCSTIHPPNSPHISTYLPANLSTYPFAELFT